MYIGKYYWNTIPFTTVGEYNPNVVLIDQVYYGILNNATQLRGRCPTYLLLSAIGDHHWSSSSTLSYASYRMERRGAWKCSYGYHFRPHINPTQPNPWMNPIRVQVWYT